MAGKVLIAEDNNDFRELLSMLLASLGYTVTEATNGLEAIEKAVSGRPDLILMDLRMPKLGGLQATKRLKENPITKEIPIVICTAVGVEAFGYAQLTGDPLEVIQKPIRLETLKVVVRKYVPLPEQRATTPDDKSPASNNRPLLDVFSGLQPAVNQT